MLSGINLGRKRFRHRAAFRISLLAPPALFWSLVFGALAGVAPKGYDAGLLHAATQVVIAGACLLLAARLALPLVRGVKGMGRRATPARAAGQVMQTNVTTAATCKVRRTGRRNFGLSRWPDEFRVSK